jgi:hypothetical protein
MMRSVADLFVNYVAASRGHARLRRGRHVRAVGAVLATR